MTRAKVTVDVEDERTTQRVDGSASKDLPAGTRFSLTSFGPDAAWLEREDARHTGYFAGSLATFGVAEVFGVLSSGIRSGRLVVQDGAARRTVSVREGQVVFASSTEDEERLGASVVRLGLLPQADVDAAIAEVRPGARLGLVLTKSGRLTAAALYGAMTFLVREIVLALFELEAGEFLFFEGEPAPEDTVKLPERTRELVLEGMRRSEARVTAKRRQLEAPTPGDAVQASALELYQAIIAEVAQALVKAGKHLSSLRAYLQEPGPKLKEAFGGVTLSDEGVIDVLRLLANVPDETVALGRARAYEALDSFLSYALFSAQNAVPKEEFTRLQAAVNVLRGGG